MASPVATGSALLAGSAALAGSVGLTGCGAAAAAPPGTSSEAPRKPSGTAAHQPVDQPWRSERPAPGVPAHVAFPAPRVTTLPNGLRVYFLHRASPIVSLSAVSRVGAASLGPGKSGLAALTARMMTEGTRRRTGLELAEAVEDLGSALHDDAGREQVSVSLSTLTRDVTRGLELLAEVVREPRFDSKDFERVRAEWLDGLVQERQNPARLASIAGLRLVAGQHVGAPVSGSLDDVRSLRREDLSSFHAQSFQPKTVALLVVGDVPAELLDAELKRLFGSWQGHKPATARDAALPAAPAQTQIVVVDRPDAVQSAIFVAQRFPKRSDPGHEAREVLSNLLGGLFTSRINTNLREQHAYTYGARSALVATRAWGAFVVSTSVRTDVTAAALTELLAELRTAKAPPPERALTEAELTRSKTDLVEHVGAALESVESVSNLLEASFAQDLPPDYYSQYDGLVSAVDLAALRHEATTHLRPDAAHVVIVGARAKVGPQLEAAGLRYELARPELSQ